MSTDGEGTVRSWCDGSSDPSFIVDPLGYLPFHPVLHDWCNKGRGMCYPVCGMMMLIGKRTVAYVVAAGFLSRK